MARETNSSGPWRPLGSAQTTSAAASPSPLHTPPTPPAYGPADGAVWPAHWSSTNTLPALILAWVSMTCFFFLLFFFFCTAVSLADRFSCMSSRCSCGKPPRHLLPERETVLTARVATLLKTRRTVHKRQTENGTFLMCFCPWKLARLSTMRLFRRKRRPLEKK